MAYNKPDVWIKQSIKLRIGTVPPSPRRICIIGPVYHIVRDESSANTHHKYEGTQLVVPYPDGFDSEKESPGSDCGNNLVLTIDGTIQYVTENALKETVKQYSARSALAIVMQPHTGAVLAIAHYPAFNPNAYRDYAEPLWRNRAITDSFEPGSTMKIFAAAAALEQGAAEEASSFLERASREHPHGFWALQALRLARQLPATQRQRWSARLQWPRARSPTQRQECRCTNESRRFGDESRVGPAQKLWLPRRERRGGSVRRPVLR